MNLASCQRQRRRIQSVSDHGICTESARGAHFRDDYPEKDAPLGKVNIAVQKGRDGQMEVTRAPIPEMPDELKRIIEEMK